MRFDIEEGNFSDALLASVAKTVKRIIILLFRLLLLSPELMKTLLLSNNLIWCFCKEGEQISPEQPYRLKPENRTQISRDNPGDTSDDILCI
jgi:hypothetical protein